MRTLEEFEEFKSQELSEALASLEKRRKSMVTAQIAIISMALFFVVIIFLMAFFQIIPYWLSWLLFIPISVLAGLGFRYFQNTESLEADFKVLVVSEIVSFVNPKTAYDPDDFIIFDIFEESRLFAYQPDHYSGDDMVQGYVGTIPFQFSELDVRHVFGEDKDQRSEIIFKGIFCAATLHISFKTPILILPNKLSKHFGILGEEMQRYNPNLGEFVTIRFPGFNDEFVVYAEDPIQARRELSADLLDIILRFERETQGALSLSFLGNQVFIALDFGRDIFTFDMYTAFTAQHSITSFFKDLVAITSILKNLSQLK
ncbi:MAG: DUF3137 domain-containing protein [Bernardetiaceae bacterium]|nr:DUF3137 domain-containing protein [Bernardetiaceae bacterium]